MHFNAMYDLLVEQYLEYRPRVDVIAKNNPSQRSSWCWGESIRIIQARPMRTQRLHPHGELIKVAGPLCGMKPVTSGIGAISAIGLLGRIPI